MTAHDPIAFIGDGTLALLAACVRPIATDERTAAIRRAGAGSFDPNRLVALAHRHRVGGFVEQGLAVAGIALPAKYAARLSAETRAAHLQTLRNAGEEIRVGRALSQAGVDALFVKGSTLAMRAHGTLSLKTSWDVDVLVGRDQLEEAGAVLAALGYRLSIMDGVDDPVQVDRYLAAHKEAEWHHDVRGTVVELHTELSDNPAAIAGIGLGSPRQEVEMMPGAVLGTLALPPLFAYLVFHGTTHLWARLKWLADVAALMHGADVEALYRDAVALGAGRTPGVALTLAHELLGVEVPEPLLHEIGRDRSTRRLLRYSRAAIAADQDEQGRLMRPLRELTAYARAQAWLVPGAHHRWGAVRRFLTQPYAPAHLRVPRWALPGVILAMLPLRLMLRPARIRRQSGGKATSRP